MGREGRGRWAGPELGEGTPDITSAYLQPRSQGAQTGHRRGSLLSFPGPAGQQHTVLPFRLLLLPPAHSRNRPAQPPPRSFSTRYRTPPGGHFVLRGHRVPAKNFGEMGNPGPAAGWALWGFRPQNGVGRVTSLLLHDVSPPGLLDFPGARSSAAAVVLGREEA